MKRKNQGDFKAHQSFLSNYNDGFIIILYNKRKNQGVNMAEYGLVFAGGGAKGAYQIGAYKAIKELGLLDKIGPVAGNSIGGINLALYASLDPDEAEKLWTGFHGKDFLAFDDNGFDITKQGDGIFSRDALLKILDNNIDYSKITNGAYSYYITVCENDPSGKAIAYYIKLNGMDTEKIRSYLMATSAIPVVYDNVIIDGHMYYDGGTVDNTPIKALEGEDVKKIIVLSCNHGRSMDADKDAYPGKEIINIIPSADLNLDAIEGTVDFNKDNATYRLKLGYLDAKAILTAYLSGTKVPDLSGNATIALQSLKMVKLENKAKDTMDNLSSMLGKYGIDM